MKTLISAVVASAAFTLPITAQEATWLTDAAAAMEQAKKEQKPILANFTGSDWCGWCIKLKDEVFSKSEFQEWAKDNVVLLELDFPRNKELPQELREQNDGLRKKYGVRGYPTILFLDGSGEQIARSGYMRGGPEKWIADADSKLEPAGDEGGGEWLTDYEAALKQAKKERKLVMADFTGSDWCGWCIKLKDEVFSKKEFQEWAKDHVVLLELDFPRKTELPKELREQNEELRKKYGVRGYPTLLFLDHKGKEVGKSGYVRGGPEAWIAAVEKELGKELKRRKR